MTNFLHALMTLRKANLSIPAETVSYVCRSLLAVLQASLFLEICRHMALPDQDHAVFCRFVYLLLLFLLLFCLLPFIYSAQRFLLLFVVISHTQLKFNVQFT